MKIFSIIGTRQDCLKEVFHLISIQASRYCITDEFKDNIILKHRKNTKFDWVKYHQHDFHGINKYFTIVIGTDCFEVVTIVRHHPNMMLNNQKL